MNVLRTRHPVALALLAGGAMAALLPMGGAVALDSPPSATAFVEVESAQLVAKGAATDVTLTYLCPAGGSASLSTSVTQRSGPEVTSGQSSFFSVPCTGSAEQVTVRVLASNGSRAFKVGTALVQANMFACGSGFCGSVSDSEEISIRR